MTYEDAKIYIRQQEPTFLSPDRSGKGYICPVCGSGSGKHGTGISRKKGMVRFICWACNSKMDIFKLYGEYAGVTSFGEQLRDLCAYYGITLDKNNTDSNERPFPLTNEEIAFLGLQTYVTAVSYSNMSFEKPKKDGVILSHEWKPWFMDKNDSLLTERERRLRYIGHDNYFLSIKERESISLKSMYLNDKDSILTMLSGKLYECLKEELLSVAKIPWTRSINGNSILNVYKDRFKALSMIYQKLSFLKNDYMMMASFYLSVLRFYLELSNVQAACSFYEMLIDFSLHHLFMEDVNINMVTNIQELLPYLKNFLFIKAKFHNDYSYLANAYEILLTATFVGKTGKEREDSFKTQFMNLYLNAEKDYKSEIWKKHPDKAVLIKRELEIFFLMFEPLRVKYFTAKLVDDDVA